MAFIDHVRACNVCDPSGFRPLTADGRTIGWVRRRLAADLAAYGCGFVADADGGVRFAPDVADFDARSAAFAAAADWLTLRGEAPALRREYYPVVRRWGDEPLARIDRAVVAHFGLNAFGIHVNGVVRGGDRSGAAGDGLSLWVARRAADRAVAPGMLDNMIAGGQPIGLSLRENLLKEAAEEAGVPAELAGRARAAGGVRYVMETDAGLKRDTLFIYDLDVPVDFTPTNADGEVAEFMLWPAARAAAEVRDGGRFKFNVNLVIVDFLIRRGLIDADGEPDYPELVRGLQGAGPGD